VSDDALLRRRRTTFDGFAETYDAARPRYPRAAVDDLVALCGLRFGDRVQRYLAELVVATTCGRR
jgi:hypothetical protein